MREDDDDLKELATLMGPTVAQYRALRHTGAAPRRQPASTRRRRRLRIAAGAGVAASIALIGALFFGAAPQPTLSAASRLSMPRLAAAPLSLRPTDGDRKHLSLKRAPLTVGFRAPRRPTRSNG